MVQSLQEARNARAVYLVDVNGNPLGTTTMPVVADTELPAAAALTDADANPTVPGVGAYMMAWTGAVWSRVKLKANNWLGVALVDSASGAAINVDAGEGVDALAVANLALRVQAAMKFWNGATWDRARANVEATLLASASRTATQTSADLQTFNCRDLTVTLDATVNAGGLGSVTLSILGKDSASGKYRTLLTGVAITTVSTNVYKVGPEIVAAANLIAQDYLPPLIRIVVTANNANPMTYSVGYALGV